ncbi:MAG: hypothetical protein ACI9YE_000256 [Psychroserpens sp.]|jgi:hypothetical protein
MRLEEAKQIKCILKKYTGNDSKSEVLLNVGSSTANFRDIQQPHINKYVFQPLDDLGYSTIHFDLKRADGVDISGNIFDLETQKTLKKTRPTIIMCCNLLEHLKEESRDEIQNIFNSLLEVDGVLLITVPFSYPVHLDPIDTYFRPSPSELCELFPNYEVLDKSIIESSTFMDEFLAYSLYVKIRILVRIFVPFFKYKEWKALMHRFMWLFKSYKISCVILKKN